MKLILPLLLLLFRPLIEPGEGGGGLPVVETEGNLTFGDQPLTFSGQPLTFGAP